MLSLRASRDHASIGSIETGSGISLNSLRAVAMPERQLSSSSNSSLPRRTRTGEDMAAVLDEAIAIADGFRDSCRERRGAE